MRCQTPSVRVSRDCTIDRRRGPLRASALQRAFKVRGNERKWNDLSSFRVTMPWKPVDACIHLASLLPSRTMLFCLNVARSLAAIISILTRRSSSRFLARHSVASLYFFFFFTFLLLVSLFFFYSFC